MSDDSFSLFELVNQDPRYPIEAYLFIREALAFASDSMELGTFPESDPEFSTDEMTLEEVQKARSERHLTGQQFCEAIRQYALNQFGYMAKVVLASWGITETKCFGDIVYNMIGVGLMKKSSQDRRSHFDNLYNFNEVFEKEFEICCNSLAQRRS